MRDSVMASTVGAMPFRTGRPARHMYTPCKNREGRKAIRNDASLPTFGHFVPRNGSSFDYVLPQVRMIKS